MTIVDTDLLTVLVARIIAYYRENKFRDEIDILTIERDNARHMLQCSGTFSHAECDHSAHI